MTISVPSDTWTLQNINLIPSTNANGGKLITASADVYKNGVFISTVTLSINQDPISGLMFYSVSAGNSSAQAYIEMS